jgi:LysM repeat protein
MLRKYLMVLVILGASACSLSQTVTPTAEPEAAVVPTIASGEATAEPLIIPSDAPEATAEPAVSNPPAAQLPAANNPAVASNAKPVLVSNCTPRTDWQLYTVVAGDTLAQIGRRSGATVAALTSANCLADANRISVGQQLRVPQVPGPVAPAPQSPSLTVTGQVIITPATFRAETNTYIVQPGGSVILTWQGAPQIGVDVIDFVILPLSPSAQAQGMQTLIGSDSTPADGATITYAVPSGGTLGYPAALAKKNGVVVSRSNSLFAIVSSDLVQACKIQVKEVAVNLYSGPANTFSIVSTIAGADVFSVNGRADNDWLRLDYPGASAAWIDSNFVTRSGDCASVPIVSVTQPSVCLAQASTQAAVFQGIGWPQTYATLNVGEQYTVIGKNQDIWYKITYPPSGTKEAWVIKAQITLTGDCGVVPETSSVRPPSPPFLVFGTYVVTVSPNMGAADGWLKVQTGSTVKLTLSNIIAAPVRVEYMMSPTGTGMTPTLIGSTTEFGVWSVDWVVPSSAISAHIFAQVYMDDGNSFATETLNVYAE